jgi:hypothetical protein
VPESATPVVPFAAPVPLPLAATLDAGRLTSDGGLPWLAEADAALDLCDALAARVPEWRRGPVIDAGVRGPGGAGAAGPPHPGHPGTG